MLSLALPGRVFVCATPTDMRKSFDGLSAVVREHLKQDPLAGDLFVFRNKRGDRLKLLYWDEDGLAVWAKRLEEGTFQFPAADTDGAAVEVKATELALILGGIELNSVERRKRYQRPTPR
ncbi:IS66 Orf2 like protein [Gemmata sp. SH-PL17]|uniref:IS66 family insertion sequence element accessory protein TnpB n=1 Tax=Gemmata sp. SH-PL17 TaxID=1630693 RepID=UPI00078B1B6D|nr:IS66 family insertion sequence element accessory protein TnpB [Gemmata sp. SH-PL17]AMV23928.1 IS66 Orf2 like protein [Gemmata sp. SH-PL17]AMV25125.1 IS66 Orf2 like protein [Gemmata sp. SH-PL17]